MGSPFFVREKDGERDRSDDIICGFERGATGWGMPAETCLHPPGS